MKKNTEIHTIKHEGTELKGEISILWHPTKNLEVYECNVNTRIYAMKGSRVRTVDGH